MKISAKGRYAVRTVINLVRSDSSGPRSIRQIAMEESISPEFLEKICSQLKKKGIIKSTRGARGGFTMAMAPSEITIKLILEAIGENLAPTPCTKDMCANECDISYFWNITKSHISEFFGRVTIENIINRNVAV